MNISNRSLRTFATLSDRIAPRTFPHRPHLSKALASDDQLEIHMKMLTWKVGAHTDEPGCIGNSEDVGGTDEVQNENCCRDLGSSKHMQAEAKRHTEMWRLVGVTLQNLGRG